MSVVAKVILGIGLFVGGIMLIISWQVLDNRFARLGSLFLGIIFVSHGVRTLWSLRPGAKEASS